MPDKVSLNKEYKGKVIDVSEAIEGLYNVIYENYCGVTETDWLFYPDNNKLYAGEKIVVTDGKQKFIKKRL